MQELCRCPSPLTDLSCVKPKLNTAAVRAFAARHRRWIAGIIIGGSLRLVSPGRAVVLREKSVDLGLGSEAA